MFRKKNEGEKRQLLDGVHLKTLVHSEKTLMGEFNLAKGAEIPPHAHPHEQTGIIFWSLSPLERGDPSGNQFHSDSVVDVFYLYNGRHPVWFIPQWS